MKEALAAVCKLIKETRRVSKFISNKLTDIAPLVRKLESGQKEITELRKVLQAQLKKIEAPEKPRDQKLDFFKVVARALEPAMLKKKDLVVKLQEQGVHLSGSFQFLLSQWRNEGLFNTSFGNGWYCLSAKGRSIAGLPAKSSRLQESVEPKKTHKELEAEIVQLKAELSAAAPKQHGQKEKLSCAEKVKKQRALSQLDLVVRGLYDVRPRKLKHGDIKSVLEKQGKVLTTANVSVLLVQAKSKGLVVSSGGRRKMDYWLTQNGEEKAKQLIQLQSVSEIDAILYTLEDLEKLTEEHQDVLNEVFGTLDVDRQRLYKAQDGAENVVWVWWGLANTDNRFTVPQQPLLGHLLKHKAFPEALELPVEPCYFKIDGQDMWFDPNEKADDKIIGFVKQNDKLPEQVLA